MTNINLNTTNRDLTLLSPTFKEKVEGFLKEIGHAVFVTEGWRSDERQAFLYAQGRTAGGTKVTWTLNSKHQEGNAIDIAFKGDSLYPNDIERWKKVALIAKAFGIDWGFDLWGIDKPHFQDNGKPYIIKETNMKQEQVVTQYGPIINGCPSSVYGVRVEIMSAASKPQGLLKLKGVTTNKDSCILIHPNVVKRGENAMKKVLMHEFSHLIYHTILKNDIWEKIDSTDMTLTKYEYWDYLSKNIKHYITEYASTHTAEDFAECIGYSHYIENNIPLPEKASWNDDIKFKYIIANNLYKHGLKVYLKK